MRFIKCRILTRLWITVYNILFTILFEIPFFKTILTPFNLFYKPFCWVIIWYLNVIAISFCEYVCMFLDRRKMVLVWRIQFNLVFLSLFLFSKCVFILNKVDIGGKFLGWKSLVFGKIFYNFHYIPVALSQWLCGNLCIWEDDVKVMIYTWCTYHRSSYIWATTVNNHA